MELFTLNFMRYMHIPIYDACIFTNWGMGHAYIRNMVGLFPLLLFSVEGMLRPNLKGTHSNAIVFFVRISDRYYRVVCRYQDGLRRAKPLARRGNS